jgi:hypothetical protein
MRTPIAILFSGLLSVAGTLPLPAGGPPNPRSRGGDEVALFYAAYVAVDSDRRLFIADAGNARILSVKLDYPVTEKLALRNVPDGKQ